MAEPEADNAPTCLEMIQADPGPSAESPPTPSGRDLVTGQFVLRNKAAEKHGLFAYTSRDELPPEVRVERDHLRLAIINDQGGPSEMTAVLAETINAYVDVTTMRRLVGRG